MLLQTNSYIVPKDKRAEHSRLIRRLRQTLLRLGCDHFEVYEQVGANWSNSESAGRYVQILRFLDRKHQLAVQQAERSDPTAQAVIADFCELINFPYQQQQGLFAVGFYTSVLPIAPKRGARGELISTVEHEVVDDPEAEEPYAGPSDGPPTESERPMESVAAPVEQDFVAEQTETAPLDAEATPVEVETAPIEPLDTQEPVIPSQAHAGEAANSEAGDDFMDIVTGDLKKPVSDVSGDHFEDDHASGFIEGELLGEDSAHSAKEHQ